MVKECNLSDTEILKKLEKIKQEKKLTKHPDMGENEILKATVKKNEN